MKKYPVYFLLCLIVVVILAGCQRYDAPPEITPASISTVTETAVPQEIPTITFTPSLQPTENPQPTQLIEGRNTDALDCGENFCQILWEGYLERPFDEDYRQQIDLTYPYASTKDGTLDPHHGVEFPNPFGTPVLAAASGEVVYAGSDEKTLLGPYKNFYGNVVIIKHLELFLDKDVFTLYAHLSSVQVEVGDLLTVGEKLGEVGASGAAGGAHLHFEVRLVSNAYSRTVNPVLWFSPIQSQGSQPTATLAGVILDRNGQPRSELDFVLERIDAQNSVVERTYLKTYHENGANRHPAFGENFTVPDIPAGEYRLSLISGSLYEEYFTLEPGMMGFITLREK